MKKFLKITLVFTVIIGASYIGSKFFNCSFIRDYRVDTDKRIREIKEKIADIEHENIKDTKNLERLSEQYSHLGTIYLKQSLWDMAVDAFQKSISYGRTTPGVLYSLGLAYANRGSGRNSRDDIDKAEFYYKKSIEKQNDLYDARNALAILLFYHKDEKERALSIVEDVVSRNKKFYLARFTLGRFYYEMDKPERSLSVYEDLLADLDKLPPSEIIDDYKKNCRENIQRIMSELRKQKGG